MISSCKGPNAYKSVIIIETITEWDLLNLKQPRVAITRQSWLSPTSNSSAMASFPCRPTPKLPNRPLLIFNSFQLESSSPELLFFTCLNLVQKIKDSNHFEALLKRFVSFYYPACNCWIGIIIFPEMIIMNITFRLNRTSASFFDNSLRDHDLIWVTERFGCCFI